MFESIDIVRMAKTLAAYSADRQAVVSANVANADTPGFRAKDLPSFGEVYRTTEVADMRRSRATHLEGIETSAFASLSRDAEGQSSPNGNSVSLETEMVRAVEVKRGHDLALAVYRTSLDLMRTSLGRSR